MIKISKQLSFFGVFLVLVSLPALMIATSVTTSHAAHDHASGAAISEPDLAAIRNATKRFQDVKVAEKEGYNQFLGCVSGPNGGAMGIHFANGALVEDGVLDPLKPDVLIYEPVGDKLQLVGMEYVVIAEAWHAKNQMPPVMANQLLQYAPSPNRYGMPPHYELHIWAWRANPTGTFADWNPKVLCGG